MKLGFITATDPKNPFNKIEPSGLLYMASYLEKYLNFQDVIITEDLERLLEEKPDIVGISTYTTYLTRATEIADIIKEETSVPVIIGGPHVTLYPEYLPESCDIGVIGEGEETMLELLELYLKEKSFEPHELKKIHGIIFKEDSIRVKTQPRELIYPLDRIPPPKRELVENSFFVPSIMTSRGCPYRCAFCATSQVWKKFRMFSSEYVAREMVSLIDKDNFNKIEFGDDLFAVSTERVRDIHDIVIKNRFHEKTVFYVNVRANTFNEEMCRLLKEMNVTKVFVGFESGSDKILKFYNKKQTVEDNQRVIDLCYKYDLALICSFIAGAPVETKEDIRKTYDFIYKNSDKIASFVVCVLQPYPGTEVWNYIISREPGKEQNLLEIMNRTNFSEHLSDAQLGYYINKMYNIECLRNKYLCDGLELANYLLKTGFILRPEHRSLSDLLPFINLTMSH